MPYQRKSKSRSQLEAEAAREHYLDLVAAEEAEQGDEAHALEVAKKRKLSQGARFTKLATPKRKTQAGPKLELTANKKLSIVKMLQESKPEFADLASYWKAMEQRTGLSRRQLKHFLGTAKKLQDTAELPLKKFNTKNRRRKRLSGAGHKVPFPEEVAQLKQWLEVERACGHTVGKSDLLREFCTILRATAQHLRDEAKNALLSPLQKAEKILTYERSAARYAGLRVRGFAGPRVHGFAGSRVRGFAGSRVRGFTGSRVRGFAGSRVRGFAGSRVRGFTGSRVHGFAGSRVREPTRNTCHAHAKSWLWS